MSRRLFQRLMHLLYTAGFTASAYVLWHGWPYYRLPLLERPYSPQHAVLKPGGLWGHGLGILGGSMILLLFLYSARKRELFGLRWGRTSRWLDVHIFFGIMGPILVTLHTSFKFSGIVAISYYSMLAVMFSGILGRYIYMQIPRDPAGDALSMRDIDAKDRLLTKILVEEYGISPSFLEHLQSISGAHLALRTTGIGSLLAIARMDLQRPYRFWQLRRFIHAQRAQIPPKAVREMMRLARQKALLMRRRAFIDSVHAVFHYWHVVHKPFAYVMIVIMFVHIVVTVTFGYRWIF